MLAFSPGLARGSGLQAGPPPTAKAHEPGSLARPRDPRLPVHRANARPARRHKARPPASPSYEERHSVLCFLCFLPMAMAGQGRGAEGSSKRRQSVAAAPAALAQGPPHPWRSWGRTGSRPEAGTGPALSQARVLPGQGRARCARHIRSAG